MVLEKRGTISEEENRLFFSSFCMTKRKIFCPFYFYKMGRWRLRKANRHNPKGIKGESETSPFSSHIVIQERSALYYNVIASGVPGFRGSGVPGFCCKVLNLLSNKVEY